MYSTKIIASLALAFQLLSSPSSATIRTEKPTIDNNLSLAPKLSTDSCGDIEYIINSPGVPPIALDHLNLGLIYMRRSKGDDAQREFNNGLGQIPESAYKERIQQFFNRCLIGHNSDPLISFQDNLRAGQIYLRLGDYNKSAAEFEEGLHSIKPIEFTPTIIKEYYLKQFYEELLMTHYHNKDWVKVVYYGKLIKSCEKGEKIMVGPAELAAYMFDAYFNLKDYNHALNQVREHKKLSRANTEYLLGVTYLNIGLTDLSTNHKKLANKSLKKSQKHLKISKKLLSQHPEENYPILQDEINRLLSICQEKIK